MIPRLVLIAAALVIASACGNRDARAGLAADKEFEFAAHRVRAAVPGNWSVLDQGRQKRLRNGESEIVLENLGPADPDGVRREVERARDLWKAGQSGEAQLALNNLHAPAELFPTAEDNRAYQVVRARLAVYREERPFETVAADFVELLGRVSELPARTADQLAEWGLTQLGHDQRRDVKSRRTLTVDGHDAVEIETWSRLDHTYPQRFLFVADSGDLLALHTPREADAASAKVFESVSDSLHFLAPGPVGSLQSN